MSLDKYWQKRNFEQTPEPRGEVTETHERLVFIIQKHAATRLHYDFRLELDGVLKSWAVPKGPSLDPSEKRLAVHVEDHPLDYQDFEGIIPEHQYGAGTVLLWDRGYWIPEGDPVKGYKKGHLKFRLQGEKLAGTWNLLRMHGRDRGDKEQWLLVKDDDDFAEHGDEAEITELRTESVASGRRIEQIAAQPEAVWQSNRQPEVDYGLDRLKGARQMLIPAFVEPQLATLVDKAPADAGWIAEAKYDGYRMLCRIDQGIAAVFSRNAKEWTAKVPDLTGALKTLAVKQAWLDGELIGVGNDGSHGFQVLQNAFEERSKASFVYYAFDLMYLDGYDLHAVPLAERKRLLHRLLEHEVAFGRVKIIFGDHIEGDAQTVFEQACAHNMEGIIAKIADARYEGGRSKGWVKVKCERRQEFVITGYTDPAGSRKGFGSLLLGYYDHQGKLHYAGRVGTGFDQAMLKSFMVWLKRDTIEECPFIQRPPAAIARTAHWVKPEKVAEVRFAEWTNDGLLRQAAFLGLREDKPAKDVLRENAEHTEIVEAEKRTERGADSKPHGAPKKKNEARATQRATAVAGVTLSHPDRILFPDVGLTKLDLALYYESIADYVLPQLQDRPLTLIRCPNGSDKQCFFQKHLKEGAPEGIEGIEVDEDDGKATYMLANTLPALIGLVQIGALELHTWGSRRGALHTPDRMIFDLDPDPELEWKKVLEGVRLTRALLQEIGLQSFVKTTGGKGLHVVVPLEPQHDWDVVKRFSETVAEHLAQTIPSLFTAKLSKSKRGNKIFIDYLRNASGATAVASFSTRAKPGAPVSAPLHWDELDGDIRSNTFTVENLAQRLQALKTDPWAGYDDVRQTITKQMISLFKS